MLAIENVHDIEIALAASEQGSFSGASRVLGITQPAVSKAVARLERQLGVTLFDRQESGHGSFLTDAGAVLLSHAITALDELRDATREVAELQARTTIRVGLPSAVAHHYFPEGIGPLVSAQRQHPVEIVLLSPERLREELRLRQVDVGMMAAEEPGIVQPHATVARVAAHPLMLALRGADHPDGGGLSVEGLARRHVPIIAFSGERFLRTALEHRLAQRGYGLNAVAETDQVQMFYQLVGAGMGVGLASSLVCEEAPSGIALLPPTDAQLPELNVFVFADTVRASGPLGPAIQAIRRALFAAVRG